MKTIKYTTDGKKVVVIGDLNQTEKIVQEIYVTEDGAEIPTGERFVVKSLLDEPAVTWQEKRLKKLEEEYDKESRKWLKLSKEKETAYDALRDRVEWLKGVAKQPHPEALTKVVETLSLFLSNTDTWIFLDSYDDWHLHKFDESGIEQIHHDTKGHYPNLRIGEMKLVTLFGNTKGDLQFKISNYSDGSGSNKKIEYFKSKEDAMTYMQNRLDSIDEYDDCHFNIAKKHNLNLDSEKVANYVKQGKADARSNIKIYNERALRSEEKIKELDELLKTTKHS